MHTAMPFGREMGMRAVALNQDAVILKLDWAHGSRRPARSSTAGR